MKIFSFKIKKYRRTLMTNIVIACMLLTVFAFSYVGGTLQVFSRTAEVKAIYNGNTNSNNISLMINIYWGDEYLDPILNVLQQNNVKTTFFVGGVWATKNSDMLNKILENGHELGNHGFNHKDSDKISANVLYEEISKNHEVVKDYTNYVMTLFAPPSGAYNTETVTIAESLGYKTIMWTRDTIDWRDQNEELIYSRAIKNAKGGDLILMHPTAKTLEALPGIISHLQDEGFNLTTVSETLK